MNCAKINSCEKINIILDKDMLDFQYTDCINKACASCANKLVGSSSFHSEWMPENPCSAYHKCDEHPDFKSVKCAFCSRTPPPERDKYQARITSQKKLLEHLIATTDESKNCSHVITHTELESMLMQLERKNV